MKVSIETATRLYEFQQKVSVEHITVSHQPFREFSYLLTRFIQTVKDLSDDEFWSAPIRILKRYRFEMSVAPLGFGNRSVMPGDSIARLENALEACRIHYPEQAKGFEILLERLKGLMAADENPFIDQIMSLARPNYRLALVIKESRHIPILEEILAANYLQESVTIVSEAQLRKPDISYPVILCVGAGRWFADYVFRAPRTEKILVMRFSWIKDSSDKENPVFLGSAKLNESIGRRPSGKATPKPSQVPVQTSAEPMQNSTVQVSIEDTWLTDEDLIPHLDLAQVSRQFSTAGASTGDVNDETIGRLFQLEGRRGVFLESQDSSTALVIDLEEDENSRVRRVPVNQIQSGMFILLRAYEGEGNDYIIPIADKILGKRAESLRRFQKKWKENLLKLVKDHGPSKVIAALKHNGSTRANEINLRNWLSPRNIATANPEDFYAIMSVVGLKDMAAQCWKYAAEIDRAHSRAGRVVRRQLLHQVQHSDLQMLEQRGEMKFELAELGGKPLLALRVVRVSEDATPISYQHINKFFELEDDQWHG